MRLIWEYVISWQQLFESLIDDANKTIALVLVSCIIRPSHHRDYLSQGQTIARILVEAESGEKIEFAIGAGEHTYDIYWDAPK